MIFDHADSTFVLSRTRLIAWGAVRGRWQSPTIEAINALDAELAAVAREESVLRLRLGQVLEAMQRKGCCFELGFSSLGAYAR